MFMENLGTSEKGFLFKHMVGEKGTYDEEP